MRRRQIVRGAVAGGSVVALAAAGVLVLNRDDPAGAATTAEPATTATAEVIRTDLVKQTDVDGTLGYAHTYAILAEGRGRITWLPAVGDEIRRGRRVFEVDGHRVPLFYGSTPLWRSLEVGMSDGKDVLELERNLKALGYGDGLTVDREFTWVTAQAVREWQEDLGVTETGRLSPGDVVVQPGKLRISKVDGTLGSPAGGTVLTATDTERMVTVDLEVTEQEVAEVGAKVQVELPGGRTTTGRVHSIGTVAESGGDEEGPIDPREPADTATIPVEITLTKAKAAGRLDGAPVTVGFTGATSKDVLAVPVNALLAGADGGYAVEVVDPAGNRTVPVELGIFADGQVEVTGDGLAEGLRVEVPRS